MTKIREVMGLLAVVPFLAACPSPDRAPDMVGDVPEAVEPAAPTVTPTPDAERISLDDVAGTGVRGGVALREVAAQTSVMIDLEEAPPGTTLPAHIHQGSCAEGGPVAIQLEPVQVDAAGTGSSVTTVDEPLSELVGRRLFVQVHQPGGAPLACADVGGAGAGGI
jgi:hypothetical protein